MTNLRRTLVAPLAAVAVLSTVAACGSGSGSTSTSSSSSGSSSSPGPSGMPSGGMGAMQTFTAVDLNTNGKNAAGANTAAVTTAATAFLATLPAATKAAVTYPFSDNQSRQTWSNYPAAQVPRKGVALSKLTAASRTAAMALVKTMLSAQGYSQVEAIQKADDWLHKNTTMGNDAFGSDLDYYIAVYGTPSASAPFMVQFGGHHLARNYTYKGTTVSITPDFSGTEPKTFTAVSDEVTVEPLKAKAGTLFALFDSLTAAQNAKAKLTTKVDDILMGPSVDSGKFPATTGEKVSELSAAQKKLVVAAIAAWVDDAAPGEAAAVMKTYQSQLNQTTIAYANSTTVNGENTYLRIDGPRVWIELTNTRSQSTPNVHYHGVYRDKDDDYGSTDPSS